jgi:glycosyltransferase involved in cell wall biosynthesis
MNIMFNFIFRVLDAPISAILIMGFLLWFISIYFYSALFRVSKKYGTKAGARKILFFVAEATYTALKEKGVLHMIADRDEGGYFDFVYTIHPFISPTQTIEISDKNILTEYGTERYSRLKDKGLKYASFTLILWSLIAFTVSLIRKKDINIIRSTSPHLAGLIGLICSKLTRTPFCVSIHADYDLQYKIFKQPKILGSHKLDKRLEKFVLSYAKMVMPISKYVAEYAIKSGARPESIRLIPHGIEPAPFLQSPDMGFKRELGIEDKKVVSFVGRLAKDNYVKDVVEIASQVCQRQKNVVFLMVGDGEERENLKQLSKALGISKNVRFLGYQPNNRVAQIMLVSNVNLCPLSGFSLIEAAISGKPVVAYDVEWHSELIKNNETGFLIPEGDIEGAANAILKLLDNPELAKKLGENARKLAIEKHSLENTSKIKIKCYEELIGG